MEHSMQGPRRHRASRTRAWPLGHAVVLAAVSEWAALMTGSAIATIPYVVLVIRSSRRLISRLTAGAVKCRQP
jgi:multiple sugar transport system permease protein